jgi:hypothetical protein
VRRSVNLFEFNAEGEDITITKKENNYWQKFRNGFPDEMMRQFTLNFKICFAEMTMGRAGRAFM